MKRLLIAVALLMPLAACTIDQMATPEQLQQVEELTAQRDAAETARKAANDRARESFEAMNEAFADRQWAKAEMHKVELEAEMDALELAIGEQETAQAALGSKVTEITDGASSMAMSALAPFVPAPAQPFLPFFPLLLPLLTKRGRENLSKSVKTAVIDKSLLSAGRSLLASYGMAHTHATSEDVIKGAISVVRKERVESGVLESELAAVAETIRLGKIEADAAAAKAKTA